MTSSPEDSTHLLPTASCSANSKDAAPEVAINWGLRVATCIVVLLAGFVCVQVAASDMRYSHNHRLHDVFNSRFSTKLALHKSYSKQQQPTPAPVNSGVVDTQQAVSNHTTVNNSPTTVVQHLQKRPKEVVVAHRGVSWWVLQMGPHFTVPCSWQGGQPLACEYVSTSHAAGNGTAQALLQRVQALVNEDCWDPPQIPPQYRNMTQVMFSMEPHTYRPCFDQQVADAEMTYRTCSQVWSPYYSFFSTRLHPRPAFSVDALRSAPLPAAEKLAAIVYINSNCEARSGRQDVMRQLKALLERSNSRLEVHSYGQCDPNMNDAAIADMQAPAGATAKAQKKLQVFRKYRYCVTMENSITRDYVSEKLYDGLVAGCVPIYLGAPNVADYVPDNNAIINYSELGSAHALKAELERLTEDEEAYAAKLAWKTKDIRQWNPGFQQLLAYSEVHPLCHLCRFVADAQQTGKVKKGYTLCSANASWDTSS